MYLHWNSKTISDFSDGAIEAAYNDGFVFTRVAKGSMDQTRSARIDLAKFEPTSENRRILKKVEGITLTTASLPYADYHWSIGKLATDFYKARDAKFSANKIKELMTDASKSNFNKLFIFSNEIAGTTVGYCIAFESEQIVHYSYPFYTGESKDLGLGMMLKTIEWAKQKGKKYMYIGSLQRPSDTYKLQFAGFEWFDGKAWSSDLESAKNTLRG